MSLGLAYDFPEGRDMAAAITSLMGGTAYRTSGRMAEMAPELPAANSELKDTQSGAFPGYERRDPDGMSTCLHRDPS
jgi:ribonucleotide reductase alpha subunit